jgi:kumamolisin
VRGTVDAVEKAFGARYALVREHGGKIVRRSLTGPTLPPDLAGLGARAPELASLIRKRPSLRRASLEPKNRTSTTGPYWFDDLKQAYGFPSFQTVTGRGRTIAIMGVSDVSRHDLDLYFGHENLATPSVRVRNVLGGAAFDPSSVLSAELDLDLQQAGGMAPKADLVVYNLPDTNDDSFIAGYVDVVEDDVADIVNTSFGACESFYAPSYAAALGSGGYGVVDALDNLFRQGNAQGITFVNSSGDLGALDCVSLDNITTTPRDPPRVVGRATLGVDFFASSPHVTAVGGTNLVTTHATGSLTSAYVRENARPDSLEPIDPYGFGNLVANAVWGSGGGFSSHFAAPRYQSRTGSPFRSVPDVSMQMGGCPGGSRLPCGADRSFVIAVLGGQLIGLVGTSASAPEFAGVLALEEEAQGGRRLGNVNFALYQLAPNNGTGRYFHQAIPGDNGHYETRVGYNKVLGNGTPIVKNLIGLPDAPVAGTPRSPSNP